MSPASRSPVDLSSGCVTRRGEMGTESIISIAWATVRRLDTSGSLMIRIEERRTITIRIFRRFPFDPEVCVCLLAGATSLPRAHQKRGPGLKQIRLDHI